MGMLTEQNSMPLFTQMPFTFRCERCFDTRLWITFSGRVEACPRNAERWHPPANAASQMLARAMSSGNGRPSGMAFDFARMLTHFSSADPCPTQAALGYMFGDTLLTHTVQLRKLAYVVEELRHVWRLPVGSRKDAPAGYWIITDLEDCKRWLRHATAAPKTQLATIWRSAKAAFPVLAGQHEFSFMDALDRGLQSATEESDV